VHLAAQAGASISIKHPSGESMGMEIRSLVALWRREVLSDFALQWSLLVCLLKAGALQTVREPRCSWGSRTLSVSTPAIVVLPAFLSGDSRSLLCPRDPKDAWGRRSHLARAEQALSSLLPQFGCRGALWGEDLLLKGDTPSPHGYGWPLWPLPSLLCPQ